MLWCYVQLSDYSYFSLNSSAAWLSVCLFFLLAMLRHHVSALLFSSLSFFFFTWSRGRADRLFTHSTDVSISPFCSCPSSPWYPGKATVYCFDRSVIHYPQLPLPILFPSLLSLISWSRWTLILAFPCPCLSSCPSCPPRLVLGLDFHLQNTLRKDVEFGVKSGIEMQWGGPQS